MLEFLKDNYLIILAIYFLIKPLLQKIKPKQEENNPHPEYSPEPTTPQPQSFHDVMKQLSQSMQNNKNQPNTPKTFVPTTSSHKHTESQKIFQKNTKEHEKISFEPYKIDEPLRNYESPYTKGVMKKSGEEKKSKLVLFAKKQSIADKLSHTESIREIFIFNEIIQRKYY